MRHNEKKNRQYNDSATNITVTVLGTWTYNMNHTPDRHFHNCFGLSYLVLGPTSSWDRPVWVLGYLNKKLHDELHFIDECIFQNVNMKYSKIQERRIQVQLRMANQKCRNSIKNFVYFGFLMTTRKSMLRYDIVRYCTFHGVSS